MSDNKDIKNKDVKNKDIKNKDAKDAVKKNPATEKKPAGKSQKAEESSFKIKINAFCDRLRDDKPFLTKVSIGVVAVLLLIVIIIAVATGNNAEDGSADDQVVSGNEAVNDGQVDITEAQEQGAADVTAESAEDVTLVSDNQTEVNVSPTDQVNALIVSYFNAMAAGDTESISSMKNGLAQEEALKIQKKSNYIESFENLNVLSKDGPVENSYVAFVYYEIKFKDIQTLAPGLTTLYICMNENGNLQINDGELAEDVTEYIKNMASAEDVKAIFDRVEVKYSEATDADAQLKQFMESLPTTLEQEVAQAMSEIEAQQAAQEAQEAPAQETAAEETTQNVTETVKATDTVNVRSSDSETADKLGKVEAGTTLTRYETKENGWSRIDYNGTEAYIKTEFLAVVNGENSDAQNEEITAQNETTTAQDDVETVAGKIVVLETVNVRKSASETADRIGTAYQGEYYDLVMEQADGWTKIKFNGQVGYVKSEFVKK